MAGLLTRPGHRAFPVLHQWQKFDVRFCGLTAAGTVPDFYRVPFSFGRRKPPETISRLQNYLYYYGHEIEMYTVEQGEKRDKRQ